MNKFTVLLSRSRDILETEGVIRLARRSLDFMATKIYKHEYFYLYEHMIKKRDPVEYLPQIKDIDFRIVNSNAEAEQLAREIGFDFRKHILKAEERLDKGAVAFLIFIQGDFAYIGWAALSPGAKNALDSRPFKVDFEHRQAYTGGNFTFLPYRNKGLMTYGYFRIFEFLEQKGITSTRNVVRVTNLSSQKVHSKFHPRICAKAGYTKILWLQFWKELPLSQ